MMHYNQLCFETLLNQRRNDVVKEILKMDYWMSVKHEILNVISLALRCDDTNMRRAVPVEKGLEIFLWRLATGNSCRNIWKLFRVGKSTDINFFFSARDFINHFSCQQFQKVSENFENPESIKHFQKFAECKIPPSCWGHW